MHLQKHAGAYIAELTKNSRERENKKQKNKTKQKRHAVGPFKTDLQS